MAHEIDLTRGQPAMAFVKQTPWHGLGQKLEEGAPIEEWQRAAQLDWEAKMAPVKFTPEGGEELGIDLTEEMPSRQVLYRSDNGKPLSIVSNRYHPVQPDDVMKFFRVACEQLGDFTMETAGALRGGKKIFGLARADEAVKLGNKDEVHRYLLMATSYDQSLPTLIQQTSVRVVCANTLAMSQSGFGGVDTQIRVSHLTKFDLDKLGAQMKLRDEWVKFGDRIHQLAEIQVSEAEALKYFESLFDGWGDQTILDEMRRKERNRKKAEEMFAIYRGAPGQRLPAANNTAWGLVNAVTYFTDHASRARSNETRLDSAWFGDNARLKARAFDQALILA